MSVSRRASFAAGIAAVRRERRKRAKMAARDDILEVEEDPEPQDCNHITVLPGLQPGCDHDRKLQPKPPKPPKPKMQPEIRPFTKESLEKINLRTANLIRDYGFLPKRAPHLEDGAELPAKFEPFPPELLGRPVEEIDQFVYEKTFCVVSRRFQKPFIQRFSASNSCFLLPPWNCLRGIAIYVSVNQYFDYLVMLTILANCAFLAMTEPINEAEFVFLGIYTCEMVIKVIAKGFILNNYTYLRNPWNWLDFIVILSGYLTSFVEMGNLAGLRTFRVLRALKTVSIMPGLKTIINALLHSVKQLAEVMTLTIFCLMVFALFALQVYMGQLRNKCVLDVPVSANWSSWVNNEKHWFIVEGNPELCGNASGARSCPHGYTCLGSIGGNPNYGFTSFDNLLWSMLTTFQLITLDYWENVYNMVVATGGPIHVIFFTIVVFFGSFYLINLMLAVVAMSYEEEAEVMNAERAREADEAAQNKKAREVTDECTIRTNSPKFPHDGDFGCGQCSSKFEASQSYEKEEQEPASERYLVVRAGQAGTTLQHVDVAQKDQHLAPGANFQAKFNITVPLHPEVSGLSPTSSSAHHSLSEYSTSRDSSVNDSGVVGDHDQDSLYDLTITNMDIINCKEKERKPSKIDIPFVVSIEASNDRNCAGCQTCCLDYKCWLRTQDILFSVINDPLFDFVVTLCIILNTVFLAIEHHGMSEDLQHILDTGNKVFTSFFLLEAILKLAALSKEYFGNGWNIFDLTIVVASLLDLGLESVDGISVLRGMRLMRVLKLAQSWTTMKVLLSIIISTLGALGNLTFILLIVIYIFAVLGMQMFGMDYTAENFAPDPIPRWNFTDFFHSFMMIFRILCGEWVEPLWDCMRCQLKVGNPESCLAIFLPALVMGNFMVLNLFLALLLNSFNCEELKSRKEEVEVEEKSILTEKLDALKAKIKEKKATIRSKVGLPALESTGKFTSNGSLLSQNGIKYSSEPELQKKEQRSSLTYPDADGYRNFREGDEDDFDHAVKDCELNRRSMSERDINDICHKSKSLTFDNDNTEHTDPAVHIGPEPCCPEICLRMCCSCMEDTWLQSKWDLFRNIIHDIVDNPFFEWTILLLIFASSLSLCFEDINLQDNEELKFILKIVNMVFAVLFTVEMFLKWIAFGLFRYFSSVWTCLDFVIVCVSVISLAVEGNSNLTAFRSLRTLRALRPLRAISRWQGMKIVVNALMYAIPSIFNVLLVCLVFWLIFSIMGVQFFGGKFYKCIDKNGERLLTSVVNDKWECAAKNYSWVNSKITFDHVGHAYLALFQVATFEGWMEIMADAVDARDVDLQPQWEASLHNYFYFVIFIVCGSFFTLNLFIGVIIDNFNMLKKKYEGGVLEMFLTESQKHYYTAMKKLGRKKPQKVIKRPQNPYHALFYDISVSRRFEIAIFVLIFLNMVSMGIEHYDQSRAVTFVLEICNALFTTIFSLEATVKIIGLRHHYFTAAWNLFDFILVIASIIGILMEDLMTDFPVSPTLLRVVRVFRIGRILRLIKAAKGIRKLLFALIVSLPALFNIGALLALITFIYAIIGMTIFGHVKHQGALDDLVNFETFGRAMQLLFRLVTSAGWNDVLDPLMAQPPDCDPHYKDLPNGNCGFPFVSIIYFVSFIIINFMIVINMYIAIILENFNQAHQEEEIGIVEEDLEMFYSKWSKFDPHATQFITFNQMSDFIASLDPPLGIPKPNTLAIVSFDLPIAKGDKIHCLDVLHSLTKYTLGFVEDESEDFAKLTEQMDEKFKKQFPTRKELEIVSSTREWKRLDTAARCIQKFYRIYIRSRNAGEVDQRIDIETQTRLGLADSGDAALDPSPRSTRTSDSMLGGSDVPGPPLPNNYYTRSSGGGESSNGGNNAHSRTGSTAVKNGRGSAAGHDVSPRSERLHSNMKNNSSVSAGRSSGASPKKTDRQRDRVAGSAAADLKEASPHPLHKSIHPTGDDIYKGEEEYEEYYVEEEEELGEPAVGSCTQSRRESSYQEHPAVGQQRGWGDRSLTLAQPPITAEPVATSYRDMYSTHPPPHQRRFLHQRHQHQLSLSGRHRYSDHYSSHITAGAVVVPPLIPADHDEPLADYERPDFQLDHYHLYEDEVCYKCDTAAAVTGAKDIPAIGGGGCGRVRHPAGGQLSAARWLSRATPAPPACDTGRILGGGGGGGGRRLPQIPQQAKAMPQITVWGEQPEPGRGLLFGYEDEQQQHHHNFRRQMSSEQKQRSLPRTPHDRQLSEDVQLPRRPLSAQVSPLHYATYEQEAAAAASATYSKKVPDPAHHYPHHHHQHPHEEPQQQQQRRLRGSGKQAATVCAPEQQSQQRRKLPRIVTDNGGGVVGSSGDEKTHHTPHYQPDDLPRRQASPGRHTASLAASETSPQRHPSRLATTGTTPHSSNRRGQQQPSTSSQQQGQLPHRSHSRTAGLPPPTTSRHHHHGHHHSRTKSDSGALRSGGGRSGKSRMRRQSPVEERLSVHEDDSMSDAFDDDGLFQIDENFAKFLDDKTSCQK